MNTMIFKRFIKVMELTNSTFSLEENPLGLSPIGKQY